MEELADVDVLGGAALERVSIREALSVPEFALAREVYEGWSRLSRDGMAARGDLDPLSFGPRSLPNMALIDVLDDARDFRWRLTGERVGAMLGTRLAGQRLSALEAKVGDWVLFRELLGQVVRYRAPRFYVLRQHTAKGMPTRTFGVLLPLGGGPSPADAPAPVSTILSASDGWSGK